MTTTVPDPSVLDDSVWCALTTHHAPLAEVHGAARRYRADVSRFSAFDPAVGDADPQAWDDLATLAGPGGTIIQKSVRPEVEPPEGWTVLVSAAGLQMVLTDPERLHGGPAREQDPSLVTRDLTDKDVDAMVALVALTDPGPFEARTIEMGRYLGTFAGDRLVAMAGERVRLTGYTEISAVCTHPDAQGRGLATALVRTVGAGIAERGETPFLNVRTENDRARELYERLGFTVRTPFRFRAVRRVAPTD